MCPHNKKSFNPYPMNSEEIARPLLIQNDVNRFKLVHDAKLIEFEDEARFTGIIRAAGLDAPYHGSQFTIHAGTVVSERLPLSIKGDQVVFTTQP